MWEATCTGKSASPLNTFWTLLRAWCFVMAIVGSMDKFQVLILAGCHNTHSNGVPSLTGYLSCPSPLRHHHNRDHKKGTQPNVRLQVSLQLVILKHLLHSYPANFHTMLHNLGRGRGQRNMPTAARCGRIFASYTSCTVVRRGNNQSTVQPSSFFFWLCADRGSRLQQSLYWLECSGY